MINTRKQTNLRPFERSVLENFISFTSKPPTTEDALLQLYTLHKDNMQEKTSRQSSQRQAAKQTITEMESWWIKAGFLFQSSNGFIAKLLKLLKFHHARWMAKVIYTLKIAQFQTQLVKLGFVTQNTMD